MTDEKKFVFKWDWYCGRMGGLDGLFVATKTQVGDAVGQNAYFGEVLGKHSEVYGDLEEKDFKELTDNVEVVKFVEEHGPFGFNPLSYIEEDEDEDEKEEEE